MKSFCYTVYNTSPTIHLNPIRIFELTIPAFIIGVVYLLCHVVSVYWETMFLYNVLGNSNIFNETPPLLLFSYSLSDSSLAVTFPTFL